MTDRPDFDVGDLVVCVDDGPSRSPSFPGPVNITKGAVYRVCEVLPPGVFNRAGYPTSGWGAMLVGVVEESGVGFCCTRFRKIDKASDDWAAEWEACKPKERVQ